MCISLRTLIYHVTFPEMVYYKKKNELFDLEELDIYKLQEYKDYVFLPYVSQASIYDAFLDAFHLTKVKKELHQKDDFEVEFRKYIDFNKKYRHELFRYYHNFEIEYLSPIVIDWCNKNKIHYYDDIL